MSPGQAVEAGLRHIHIAEPAPNLGHGPLWLGYLIDGFAGAAERLSISYPDTGDYRAVVESRAAANAQWRLRPYAWRSGRQALQACLQGADRLGADLTVFSDLGWLLKRVRDDLRRRTRSPIWGIWFSPPPRRLPSDWRPARFFSRRLRNAEREQRALRHPPEWLDGVWVLDGALAERIERRAGLSVAVLPDPWPGRPDMDRSAAREALSLPGDGVLFLHVGVAAARKGLDDAIAAWEELADTPRAVLVRAGPTEGARLSRMEALERQDRALLRNERPSDIELNRYLAACDWVLLPYRWHEGSSGLLTGACVARRPVIASDYGVLGRRVRDGALGLLYPHLSAEGLASACRRAVTEPVDSYQDALAEFARQHDREHFVRALRAPWHA